MKRLLKSYIDRLSSVLSSGYFFVVVVFVLFIQSLWLTLTAIYPLPFDEYFHFGIIKIYAGQWSPIIANQMPDASPLGDITRQPSYLYHYIMSFPYRVINLFSNDQTFMIISLRIINVIMVCLALILFRRLLISWGLSKRLVHFVLAIFVLTPIVPFLAAHINYDNLVLVLAPLLFIFATRLINNSKKVMFNLITLMTIGMAASLVKVYFLPIFAVTFLYVFVILVQRHGKKIASVFNNSWKNMHKGIGLVCLLLIFSVISVLFIERSGVNLIRYKTIEPDCAQVQTEKICSQYMPWQRNKNNELNKPTDLEYGNIVSYGQHWVSKMTRGYFAIFSHTPTKVVSPAEPFGPIVLRPLLPIPIVLGSLIFATSAAVVFVKSKKMWGSRYLRYSMILCSSYLAILFVFNYLSYQSIGAAQAIQARYTYPILILIFALIATAFSFAISSRRIKTGLAFVIVVAYLQGGGILGYLIRSDSSWYWQENTVIQINQSTQGILKRIIIN